MHNLSSMCKYSYNSPLLLHYLAKKFYSFLCHILYGVILLSQYFVLNLDQKSFTLFLIVYGFCQILNRFHAVEEVFCDTSVSCPRAMNVGTNSEMLTSYGAGQILDCAVN